MRKIVAGFFMVFIFVFCSSLKAQSQNICDTLYQFCARYSKNVQAVTWIKNGNVCCQHLQEPLYKEHLFDLHSCTKSVLSILVGIAIQQGSIKSEEQLVTEFIPFSQINNQDKRWQTLTIKNLLTMRSGFNPDESLLSLKTADKIFSQIKFSTNPGENFNYNEFDPQLLVCILEKATGTPLNLFAEKFFFAPLQITNYEWGDFKSQKLGGSGLRLTSADMAKIGWLMADSGKWSGKNILPISYWKNSLTDNYGNHYGYYWWLYHDGDFCAIGHDCQYIYGSPVNRFSFVLNTYTPDSLRQSLIQYLRDSVLYSVNRLELHWQQNEIQKSTLQKATFPDWFKNSAQQKLIGSSNIGKASLSYQMDNDSNLVVNVSSKKITLNILAGKSNKQLSISEIKENTGSQKLCLASTFNCADNAVEFTSEELYSHDLFTGKLFLQGKNFMLEIKLNNVPLLSFKHLLK